MSKITEILERLKDKILEIQTYNGEEDALVDCMIDMIDDELEKEENGSPKDN